METRISLSSTYSTLGGPAKVKVWKNRTRDNSKSGEVLFEIEVPAKFGFNYLRKNKNSTEYVQIEHHLEQNHGLSPDQFEKLVDIGSITIKSGE